MLTGKYLNKYYVKYFWFYFVGVIGLVAVDYLQLYVPDFLGRIVKMFNSQGQVDMARLSNIILALIGVAFGMFFGRMLWRFTIFNASQRIEASLRHDMFLKS